MKPVSFVRTVLPKGKSSNDTCSNTVCASCRYAIEDGVDHAVSAGYRNPLSLDNLLVQHPAATYFVEVGSTEGEVQIQENKFLGVLQGDILTIDRALPSTLGKLVLVVREGAFSLCRFTEHEGRRFLVCGMGDKVTQELCDGDGVFIWGVVSALSRRL